MRKQDYYHRLAKTSGSTSIFCKFCYFRNKAVSMVRKAKFTFLKSISAFIRTPKQFWSMCHSRTPNRERIPHILTPSLLPLQHLWPTSSTNFPPVISLTPLVPQLLPALFPGTLNYQVSSTLRKKWTCSLLSLLKVKTSTGPDGISSYIMLQNTAYSISSSLCKLFNHSLCTGCFPTEWKISNVTHA